MILAISLTTLLLSQAPHVELDFNSMGSGDRKGKRFDEIAPVDQIKRVVRVNETGFARDAGPLGEQADLRCPACSSPRFEGDRDGLGTQCR